MNQTKFVIAGTATSVYYTVYYTSIIYTKIILFAKVNKRWRLITIRGVKEGREQ